MAHTCIYDITRNGGQRVTCNMLSGDDGDSGCDCDRGIAAAALLLRASRIGELVVMEQDSSRPGTPVKKKPLGGAEVLARGVGCACDRRTQCATHLRELHAAMLLPEF